jgi:NADPH:quinone reductase
MAGTMKAIVIRDFGGPEVMQLEDFPKPVPGPGEVVLAVHAVSINRGLDLGIRAGTYAKPVKLPHILGVDPSGIVAEVGEGVTEPKVGDRVVSQPWRPAPGMPGDTVGVQHLGGYAEYVKLPARATLPVPDGLDFATATVVARHAPQAFTLLRDAAKVKESEWVLVMGASGGLGSAGIQVAKFLGAKAIAAAGADARVAAALGLGADAGINYRTQDLTAEAMKITGGKGVNVVFENIGDPELFPKALAALARQGRLVTAGAHAGGKVELDLHRLYLNQITIVGKPGSSPDDTDASLKAAAAGRLKVLIDRVLPLSKAADAHALVMRREVTGKVILDPQRIA